MFMSMSLRVYHPTQGGRLHQGGTGCEWLHRGQGLHPPFPALPGVWHSARVSGHRLQVLLNATVSFSSLAQPGTVCLCGRQPCALDATGAVCSSSSMVGKVGDPTHLSAFT